MKRRESIRASERSVTAALEEICNLTEELQRCREFGRSWRTKAAS